MGHPGGDDLWVFGYGSLMWRPGFEFEEAHRGEALGYRRSFCVYSTHHRGTHARPGLVLGLDKGGTCRGMVFRIAGERRFETLAYLRAREQINGVYREVQLPVRLLTGEGAGEVLATAFVVERAHPSYTGRLPLRRQAQLIRAARGLSGANVDYLVNTMRHADDLGLQARELKRLIVLIGPFFSRGHHGEVPHRPAARSLVAHCRQQPVVAPRMRPEARRRFLYRVKRERAGS